LEEQKKEAEARGRNPDAVEIPHPECLRQYRHEIVPDKTGKPSTQNERRWEVPRS